jgi:hypothetical protein
MHALSTRQLDAVTGGAYGDSTTEDPRYQRELLECWSKAELAPAHEQTAKQAACINTYYDKFWANRENPPATTPPPPFILERWRQGR